MLAAPHHVTVSITGEEAEGAGDPVPGGSHDFKKPNVLYLSSGIWVPSHILLLAPVILGHQCCLLAFVSFSEDGRDALL